MKFDHPSKPFSARIAAFGSVVSVGLVSSSRVVASNKYVCINACLNLPQRYNLAWQQCDDSWARAVFKMAAFSNVPVVAMWTFVQNRMLPQIKQQQLEPYCTIFFFVIYFRTTISVISSDSETNNPSFTSQHFTSLFIAIYLRCYFSSSLNTR